MRFCKAAAVSSLSWFSMRHCAVSFPSKACFSRAWRYTLSCARAVFSVFDALIQIGKQLLYFGDDAVLFGEWGVKTELSFLNKLFVDCRKCRTRSFF